MFEDIIETKYECKFCGTIYSEEYATCPSCDKPRDSLILIYPECKDCTVKGIWCGSCF